MSPPFNGRRPFLVYTRTAAFTVAVVCGAWLVTRGREPVYQVRQTERAVTVTGPAHVSPFECR